MKTIRSNVFETNSSSCHVLTLLTLQERDALLQKKAILRIVPGDDYGPEYDNISEVLNYNQFVNTILDEVFSEVHETTQYREQNEKVVRKILQQYWKDVIEEPTTSFVKQEAVNGNTYFEHRYELMGEWNELTGHRVAEILAHRLQFYIPPYSYETLLEKPAVKRLNHHAVYAVSWEKEW